MTLPAQEHLSADVAFLRSEDDAELGSFEMVAYTGAEVRRYFGRAIFDLDGMDAPGKLAILLEHSGSEIVGHADSIKISSREGVILRGPVYAGEAAGERVRRLSRLGFPWKASIGVEVMRWQELDQGETAFVNGREVTGPISIARQSRLFETSFVVNPADKATDAEAMSEDQMSKPKPAETSEPTAAPVDVESLTAAARAEGAKATREELASFLQAFPDGRRAWAAERFAAGLSLIETKAELADVLTEELAAAEQTTIKLSAGRTELEELEGEARHPGIGFDGAARQAGTGKPGAQAKLSSMPLDDAVELLWSTSAALRGEFGTKGALRSCIKHEGIDQFEAEVSAA